VSKWICAPINLGKIGKEFKCVTSVITLTSISYYLEENVTDAALHIAATHALTSKHSINGQ
jgi:hypothetical protein